MSINKVELIIKNEQGLSVSVDILDFPYRLNRTVFTTSQDRLKALGGTFSTQIELAKTKRNNQLFAGKSDYKSINKFNGVRDFQSILLQDGAEVMRGTFKLEEITSSAYKGTFYDVDIDWIDRLSNVKLNEIDNWTTTFNGAIDFDTVNVLNNRQSDILFPTIVYNNTPLADYYTNNLTDDDIWGTFELPLGTPPVRLTSAGSYPSDFKLKNGHFGNGYGLTFQDFPPAIYYRNLIEKVCDESGITVDCSLFSEDWFNALYMPYVGDGYKYNWKTLASVSSDLLQIIQDNKAPLTYPDIDDTYEADIDVPNQVLLAAAGVQPWFQDIILKIGAISTIGYDDTSTLVDKITAVNKFNIPNQYICPVDGRYTIRIEDSTYTKYDNLYTQQDVGFDVFLAYDIFDSYGSGDVNSVKTDPISDRAYAWDDHVLVILRKNQNDEFTFDTEQLLGQWISGTNQDFLINPSDVIGYLSPKRYELLQLGTLTNTREAYGSPISNFTEDVTVDAASIAHNVSTNTNTNKDAESSGGFEVTVDLLKNERIEVVWVAIKDFQGSTFWYPDQTLESIDTVEIGANVTAHTNDYEINYECGDVDLNIAENLPSITGKEVISSFIKQFNLHFTFDGNLLRFLPQKNYYTPEVYDITSRVVDNNWSSSPVDVNKFWNVGYRNDLNDRLLIETVEACSEDTLSSTNYGNIMIENDNIYGSREVNDYNMFSSTRFTQGSYITSAFATQEMLVPSSTDPVSGVTILTGIDWFGVAGGTTRIFPTDIPSIQSQSSFDQKTVGDLTYDYNYSPRLLYHLGTIDLYGITATNQACLVDSPRLTDVVNGFFDANDFVRKPKHWFKPTVSQFDGENFILTGINYPTLRYDTGDGLYNRYFEDIVDLYNKSEVLKLRMAMRSVDWINMRGAKKIRYNDQLYRLMIIKDYDPLTNNICNIELLKEI